MQGVGERINLSVDRVEKLGDEKVKMIMISISICCVCVCVFSIGRHHQSILHAISALSFAMILQGKAVIFPY